MVLGNGHKVINAGSNRKQLLLQKNNITSFIIIVNPNDNIIIIITTPIINITTTIVQCNLTNRVPTWKGRDDVSDIPSANQ